MSGAERAALLAALALQREWGADEALEALPLDRTAWRPPEPPVPEPIAPPPRSRTRAPSAAGVPLVVRAEQLAAEAQDLGALRAAIAAFEGSALRDTATSLAFAAGRPGAALMVIGDVPDAEDDRAGEPFTGPAGRLLDRMLGSIGLSRQAGYYAANLLPWRPPGDRPASESEVALFLPFVRRHVALAAPRRLLLLGGVATKALTGSRDGLQRMRGRSLQITTEPDQYWDAIATLHPSQLIRSPAMKSEAWTDLRRLRRDLTAT